jgi:hypothetical protein
MMWNEEEEGKQQLVLEVFAGFHNETAFVEIRNGEACNVEQLSPLVAPRDAGATSPAILVNHLDAVAIRRRQIAEFFVDKIARNGMGITIEKMLGRLNHHGLYFLDATGRYIASGLPFYTITLV